MVLARWHLCGKLSSPEVLNPIRCQLRVPNGVLDVFVAEPSLQRPGIVARVRQGVAAAVSQHVRMDRKRREPRSDPPRGRSCDLCPKIAR
jgi:hypothetical protein